MIPKTIRLPEALWQRLEHEAAKEKRSVNNQVWAVLEQRVEALAEHKRARCEKCGSINCFCYLREVGDE